MNEDLLERLNVMTAKRIKQYGLEIVAVAPTADEDEDLIPFSFTIGNHGRGHPELLVVGLVGLEVGSILRDLTAMQRNRGRGLEAGEIVSLGGQFPFRVVEASGPAIADYTHRVTSFYKTETYSVLQVLIPDLAGRYPGDPQCAEPFCRQVNLVRYN